MLLAKKTRGGTILVHALNLAGSIESIPNAVQIVELGFDTRAQTLLMPVTARRQLYDLPASGDLWTHQYRARGHNVVSRWSHIGLFVT